MTVEKTDTQSRHRAHFTAIRRQRNSKAATKMETCSSETETLHILGAPKLIITEASSGVHAKVPLMCKTNPKTLVLSPFLKN